MTRDYKRQWVSEEGREYRQEFLNRTGAIDNPTLNQLITDLKCHEPSSILEVGCGYGRLLGPVSVHFDSSGVPVIGLDVSQEMIDAYRGPSLARDFDLAEKPILKADICDVPSGILEFLGNEFTVGYCRGVFMYFTEEQTLQAIHNIRRLVRKKFLVYEWPSVIERVQKVHSVSGLRQDDFFEFHEIPEGAE